MNYRLFFILIFLTAWTTGANAQIKERTQFTPPTVQAPALIAQVQKVSLGVDSLKNNGDIYFAGYIISTGLGMVHYQWVLTPQQTMPNSPAPHLIKDSMLLNGTGKDKVFHVAHVNSGPTTIKLVTLSPNVVISNIENY